jgi:hypothetical protein
MPQCSIRSRGLKWELNGEILSFPGKNSQSNRAVSSVVELEILSGTALVFIYTKIVMDAGSLGKNPPPNAHIRQASSSSGTL